MREYFCAYHSYLQSMRKLSDAECGRLFRALLQYSAGEQLINLQGREEIVFDILSQQIDRDRAKYDEVCQKRSESGSKGGRPKKQKNQMVISESKKSQDKGKGKDKEENTEYSADAEYYVADGNAEPGTPAPDRVDCQAVVELYHSICVSFPKVRSLTDKRRKAIGARLKKYTIDDVREVFERMEASSFLKGANSRNWSADFDWCMMDQHFANILEGKYGERGGSSNGGHGSSQSSSGGESQTTDDPRQYWNGVSF